MNNANLDILFEEFKRKVEKFSTTQSNRTNLYDYEKGFRAITDEFEKKIFQASIGEAPKSKNKKNSEMHLWQSNIIKGKRFVSKSRRF